MARPHRLPEHSTNGRHRYFLTICAHRRRRHFVDAAVVDAARSQFLHTATIESFAILAYCYMPDHLHLVVEGLSDGSSLSRFIRLGKQRSGYQFAQREHDKLWQDSYFDRTLRSDDALADVLRYLINNPVRAGLVDDPKEYPYWGSELYTREQLLEYVGTDRRAGS
jgi:putative transposase